MKDTIVCLIGASGSGKTALAYKLLVEGYNVIQSYTTRDNRDIDEFGHIFIKTLPGDIQVQPDGTVKLSDNIIAYTYFDGAHYWATKKQYEGKGISIYIIDPYGFSILQRSLIGVQIQGIYLSVDENIREERMLHRKYGQRSMTTIRKERDVDIERRLLNDRTIFQVVQCNMVVDNNSHISVAYENIKQYLETLVKIGGDK